MAAAVPNPRWGPSPFPDTRATKLPVGSLRGMAMTDPNISWQRTFPESEPGTDGVAVFEGRIIGRIMHMTNLPRDPRPWLWSITDPDLSRPWPTRTTKCPRAGRPWTV